MPESLPPPADGPTQPADERYERFVRLFVAHEARLRGFLRTLLPRWEQIDDVMQETSLVAWRKFAQFDPNTNFLAWAGAIARFEALRHLRDRSRDRLTFSDELIELMAAEAIDDTDTLERQRVALNRCLEKLEPAQQELLRLAYQPGVRFHEVAARLGRTVQGMYKTIQRLRARLTECVQAELRQESP
jgi:RNA polymerase sigma-70 factor (ECF subfamily)